MSIIPALPISVRKPAAPTWSLVTDNKNHSIKFYSQTLNRDSESYRQKHYRAHWQPLWAILGLVLCSLLMLFSGWAAIYDLAAKSKNVSRADSIVDLIAAYLGVSPLFPLQPPSDPPSPHPLHNH